MEAPIVPTTSTGSNDVFSITDQALSDRLQFVQEIGYGNWGSVWLCRPKLSTSGAAPALGQKIAVKLVHRSKTSTTAARVRSLWNEMKIVRNFKDDPHPSIIPFHSFVLTPSYALITMTYLPTLVPVEVEELKAREWFQFLLSGIDFLHRRGVVHNDIKPANILVSHKNVPVLVDFGFAEKYDLDLPTAFHSNLSYGTPEYLSPERARGLPHDTRKSDVWSLGITFFEILIGRTPFENSDGEQFNTKEDLELYWQRTLKGKWVGKWKMTNDMEKLLERMIAPNADLRCTASQAMADKYWRPCQDSVSSHRRSSSYTSSVVFEKDMAKLMDVTPSSTKSGKGSCLSPPGLESPLTSRAELHALRQITKSRSQPKVAASKVMPSRKRERVPMLPPLPILSPIKASPPVTPVSRKENTYSLPTKSATRRPFSAILNSRNENVPTGAKSPVMNATKGKITRALGDVTNARRHSEDVKPPTIVNNKAKNMAKESTSVRDRMRDWERERERLKEMARLEEIERERDEQPEGLIQEEKQKKQKKISIKEPTEAEVNKENLFVSSNTAFNNGALPTPRQTPLITQGMKASIDANSTPQPHGKKFGHVIRASIDKTVQVYKASRGQVQTPGHSTPAHGSPDMQDTKEFKRDFQYPRARGGSQTQSWENEVNSSLPVVRNAVQNERVAADARKDRLAIWMQNVEKVVEDAKQGFAASARLDTPLPSLPVAPSSRSGNYQRNVTAGSRSNRSSRLPRKVLAASQIFADYNNSIMGDTTSAFGITSSEGGSQSLNTTVSGYGLTTPDGSVLSSPAITSEGPSRFVIPEIHTPSKQRRITVSEQSPIANEKSRDYAEMSPSKRREKSLSQGNFLQQRIASLSKLEAEINKPVQPQPNPRLSEMFDRSIFIAPPIRSCDNIDSRSMDDLNDSLCHVEPYPPRKLEAPDVLPDTPCQRRMEGVYDRFLMATSGVKRVGKGYQSEFISTPPVSFQPNSSVNKRQSRALFKNSKTPMPPPVSSDDVQRRGVSIDEMGVISCGSDSAEDLKEDASHSTVSLVRRAFKAMVPSTKSSKRLSKMVVA